MNILIVDDNANNRMILRLLLENFEEENGRVAIDIEEANDGVQAVEKCKNGNFDIVLMDIVMPNMDGIEATKIIRENNHNIMIIGISAVDDSTRQKKILNNGAEDYISKPVNADIFASRISNYIIIVESRNHKKASIYSSKKSLFKDDIYCRYSAFIINSEDSLSEFWEFFLLNAEFKYDNLSDLVRTIFSIAETQLRLSVSSEIYIEESEEYQYFTLTKIDKLPPKVVELILKKNFIQSEYKIEDGKVSFKLYKIYSLDENEDVEIENVEDEVIASTIEIKPQEISDTSKELVVFDYMDDDDLIDLEDYSSKLSSLMLIVESDDITAEEVEEIYFYLEKLGSILLTYSEVHPISTALTSLATDMSTHQEEFINNSKALGSMCKAFSNDFLTWIRMSFHIGAPSADFMNDTIVVNCKTISGMLKINEQSDDNATEELDDIFDF